MVSFYVKPAGNCSRPVGAKAGSEYLTCERGIHYQKQRAPCFLGLRFLPNPMCGLSANASTSG